MCVRSSEGCVHAACVSGRRIRNDRGAGARDPRDACRRRRVARLPRLHGRRAAPLRDARERRRAGARAAGARGRGGGLVGREIHERPKGTTGTSRIDSRIARARRGAGELEERARVRRCRRRDRSGATRATADVACAYASPPPPVFGAARACPAEVEALLARGANANAQTCEPHTAYLVKKGYTLIEVTHHGTMACRCHAHKRGSVCMSALGLNFTLLRASFFNEPLRVSNGRAAGDARSFRGRADCDGARHAAAHRARRGVFRDDVARKEWASEPRRSNCRTSIALAGGPRRARARARARAAGRPGRRER